nr:integrase, catalytic region, zinc finger, CCHC-type, peptidase aspartic, catalytic [Tanacetum cinerariifolium]
MSNISPHKYFSQSSTTPPSTHAPPVTHQPHFADNTQLDSGLSPTDNLIGNLTNTPALLTQSYKTHLPQTNHQLMTSSNTRNHAIIQDSMVVVQNIQGRQNRGQWNNATGTCTAGGHDNAVDEDMDELSVQDLALNVDNVFQSDECDAFDSDVDEAPTAQTMFMANLSFTDLVYDEAGPSYDLDILSEEQTVTLTLVDQSLVKKVWKPKQVKQMWKATGKMLINVGYQWKPMGRILTLGKQFPLTRFPKSKVVLIKQTANVVQILLWYLDSSCSKHMTVDHSWLKNFMKKFIETVIFRNDHFGAIMGYEDYVIGDSVISRVYYIEGLGHNLFSVGQFCDSDLKVAFRKHSCYVRDTDVLNN